MGEQTNWQSILRGALARAYTTDRNSHKELDSNLIEDMVTELIPIISQLLKEQKKNIKKELRKHGFGGFGIIEVVSKSPEPTLKSKGE